MLYAHDAEKNLKPASTLKLVTSAAALDASAPRLRLRTTLETTARLDAYRSAPRRRFPRGSRRPEPLGPFHRGTHPRRRSRRWRRRCRRPGCGASRAGWWVTRAPSRAIAGERTGDGRTSSGRTAPRSRPCPSTTTPRGCGSCRESARAIPALLDEEPRSDHYAVTSTATTAPAGTKTELTLHAARAEQVPPLRSDRPGRRAVGRYGRDLRSRAVRGAGSSWTCWRRRDAGHGRARDLDRAAPRRGPGLGHAREPTPRRDPGGRQQGEPEPVRRDPAAPPGAESLGPGHGRGRARGGARVPEPPRASPRRAWGFRMARGCRAPTSSPPTGSCPCSRRWTATRWRRSSASRWPSRGRRARSRTA